MRAKERFPIPQRWLSDEAVLFVDSVARWGVREVSDRRSKHREDYEALHRPALASLMGQVGLEDLLWTEASDALPSASTLAAVLEEVGRADTGLAVGVANTAALQRFIPPAEKARMSERGALGALVLAGYDRGSAAARPGGVEAEACLRGLSAQVGVEAVDNGWRLQGRDVRPQCHGVAAAYFGVVAVIDAEPALLVVSATADGVRVGERLRSTGLHACPNADLQLRGVQASTADLILRGEGAYRELLAWYYLGCAAAASGAQLAVHSILDDWCDSRVIKGRGQAFKDNALVASLLGDIGGRIATGRILTWHLARQLELSEGVDEATLATATATARSVVEGAMLGLDQAMELMASAGYATEWNLERYWRDIKTLGTYLMLETVGPLQLARHYFGCRNL